ncbi:carbohydrate porin [Acidithiobacillus ferrivorans]|uniref:Carbohydrate porin n=1 Tax=Acidithiobacillus ferrivorans TaxID=160808 RepID=A0A7T4WFH1_9PROT|nr:carbohydrate porin [Acidithiobacillus ferrivorans]QQD73490.1 carbohydrate porin [Acidithiobacillus ferrivorans]
MPLLFRPTTVLLFFCASVLGSVSDTWAADGPASSGNGPILNISGISPKYLPTYNYIADGLSWAGHLDSEVFTNLSGGIKQGNEGNIVGQIGAEYDTGKAGLWKGGKFTLSLIGIYNSAIQQNYSGDIQTASNIWAPDAVRFYDAAFRQHWTDWLNTRVGYMDVNYYFDVTANALQLMNSSFGMAPTMTVNVPGIATYPYPGLGLLVGTHSEHLSSKIALFQGNPQHQVSAFERGYMALWEGGLHWGKAAEDDLEDSSDNYGQYILKAGAWHYQLSDPDRYGLSPTTSGVYAVAEGNWSLPGERRLGAFFQMGAAPQDINPVPWYLGLGLRLGHPFASRPDDSLSIGMARTWLRPNPVAESIGREATAIRNAETAYELTYVAQLTGHLNLQPDLQYIQHPNGYFPDATVGMLRLHVEFF